MPLAADFPVPFLPAELQACLLFFSLQTVLYTETVTLIVWLIIIQAVGSFTLLDYMKLELPTWKIDLVKEI